MSEAHQRRLADPCEREKMEACLATSPSRQGVFSEEHRRRISEAMTGKKKSPEHAEFIRGLRLGQPHTEETKAKMSQTRKGRPSGSKGRVQSAEERAMRSEAHKKRYQRPGERERQAASIQERWDKAGNKHRPETIEKMKGARANQVFPLVDTKPEKTIQKYLTVLGLEFETHRMAKGLLSRHQWDIVLVKLRLLIEVDGCYWHGCERCCPNSEIGKENHERDGFLTTAAEAAGWKVVRIWEHDIIEGTAMGKLEEAVRVQQGIFESVG